MNRQQHNRAQRRRPEARAAAKAMPAEAVTVVAAFSLVFAIISLILRVPA